MDKETIETMEKLTNAVSERVDKLIELFNAKFENLKKVIGDYLELSSNISLASVKTSLKNV